MLHLELIAAMFLLATFRKEIPHTCERMYVSAHARVLFIFGITISKFKIKYIRRCLYCHNSPIKTRVPSNWGKCGCLVSHSLIASRSLSRVAGFSFSSTRINLDISSVGCTSSICKRTTIKRRDQPRNSSWAPLDESMNAISVMCNAFRLHVLRA